MDPEGATCTENRRSIGEHICERLRPGKADRETDMSFGHAGAVGGERQ